MIFGKSESNNSYITSEFSLGDLVLHNENSYARYKIYYACEMITYLNIWMHTYPDLPGWENALEQVVPMATTPKTAIRPAAIVGCRLVLFTAWRVRVSFATISSTILQFRVRRSLKYIWRTPAWLHTVDGAEAWVLTVPTPKESKTWYYITEIGYKDKYS
jgi:hypothetical protein